MTSDSGREQAPVSERLFREPYRFDFFQAVRLLEALERDRAPHDPNRRRQPVGQDRPPAREVVRFRALPALSFPAGSMSQLRSPDGPAAEAAGPPEMLVTFMGLTGPNGVLPQHYTTLLLQRLRLHDHSLADFLDLFNHRVVSLFYRAWEKYRFPFALERARLDAPGGEPDLFTQCLYCLTGLGVEQLRARLRVEGGAFLYYGGLFAHSPRSAVCLERLLADHFDFPVEVREFEGQWLYLGDDDRSRLGSLDSPLGSNTQLGVDAVAGQRVWNVQSKVRLRAGPLGYRQFQGLLPDGAARPAFVQMARVYVGPDLDFDLQLVLRPLEVPWCQLTSDEDEAARLGWNAWVRCHDFDRPVEDVILPADHD
jgi:type VI secretion system protein ImpH